jgi:hypothetical protein
MKKLGRPTQDEVKKTVSARFYDPDREYIEAVGRGKVQRGLELLIDFSRDYYDLFDAWLEKKGEIE